MLSSLRLMSQSDLDMTSKQTAEYAPVPGKGNQLEGFIISQIQAAIHSAEAYAAPAAEVYTLVCIALMGASCCN